MQGAVAKAIGICAEGLQKWTPYEDGDDDADAYQSGAGFQVAQRVAALRAPANLQAHTALKL